VAWSLSPCPSQLEPAAASRGQSADCMPCALDAAPTPAAPAAGAAACAGDAVADVTVGCLYVLALAAAAPRYDLAIRLQARPACPGCDGALAAAAVVTCDALPAGTGVGAGSGCCGDGACNGFESGHSCPVPPQPPFSPYTSPRPPAHSLHPLSLRPPRIFSVPVAD
jgi:hypothetical protein